MSLSKSEREVMAAVRDGALRKVGASRWFLGDSDAYHVVRRLERRGLIRASGDTPRLTEKGKVAMSAQPVFPTALATEHDPDVYLGIEGVDGPPPTRGWYVLTRCGRVCGVGYFDGETVRSVDPLGTHCGPASDFIRHAPLLMGAEREVRP